MDTPTWQLNLALNASSPQNQAVNASSPQNHMVEWIWVEVNARTNYPIKESLIRMMENGDISLDDQMWRFCVSWYTVHVPNVGIGLLIFSWNNHFIPCMYACKCMV